LHLEEVNGDDIITYDGLIRKRAFTSSEVVNDSQLHADVGAERMTTGRCREFAVSVKAIIPG